MSEKIGNQTINKERASSQHSQLALVDQVNRIRDRIMSASFLTVPVATLAGCELANTSIEVKVIATTLSIWLASGLTMSAFNKASDQRIE